jgi:hypothetical protein
MEQRLGMGRRARKDLRPQPRRIVQPASLHRLLRRMDQLLNL